MSTRAFRQVDVFTNELGAGNPLAVVLDADGLSDDAMASFAAWTNLSETTFVLPPSSDEADYRVRIFTPVEELPFAGHPTLGTCHAWLDAGGQPRATDTIVQECGAGLVTLQQFDGRLAFETPPQVRSGALTDDELAMTLDALGVDAQAVEATSWIDNGPGWIGVLLRNVDDLRALDPAIPPGTKIAAAALTGHSAVGEPSLEVRAFFYAGSSREDPVTGSANGSLAQWLTSAGVLGAPYISSQGVSMGRNGRVHIEQTADGGLWVGGDVVIGIAGTVRLP